MLFLYAGSVGDTNRSLNYPKQIVKRDASGDRPNDNGGSGDHIPADDSGISGGSDDIADEEAGRSIRSSVNHEDFFRGLDEMLNAGPRPGVRDNESYHGQVHATEPPSTPKPRWIGKRPTGRRYPWRKRTR